MIFTNEKNEWRMLDTFAQRKYYSKKPKETLLDDLVHMTAKFNLERQMLECSQHDLKERTAEIQSLRVRLARTQRALEHVTNAVAEINR